jgi:hypothetical protein
MTAGRITALVIGVPVCLAIVANTGFSLLTPFAGASYHVSYTAPASTRSLTVDSAGGQVSVQPAEAGRVTLAGTAHYSFIRSTVSERTSGGDTTVSYHCVALPSSNCELDATVGMPAGLPVAVSTDGGNVSVSGIAAPVTLHTGGGELSAANITKGPLDLDTDGGNITASGITAPSFSASSGGGDIQASTVDSTAVTISTSGGNIQATGVQAAKVSASTGGGEIYIVFATVPTSVSVNTSGGNITLVLPAGPTKYAVTSTTSGGGITDNLPRSTTSANKISASTGGGDITLLLQ